MEGARRRRRRNKGGRCPGERIGETSETERDMYETSEAEMDKGGRGRTGGGKNPARSITKTSEREQQRMMDR